MIWIWMMDVVCKFLSKWIFGFSKGHCGFTQKMMDKLQRERVQFITKGVEGWMAWMQR